MDKILHDARLKQDSDEAGHNKLVAYTNNCKTVGNNRYFQQCFEERYVTC